MVFCKDLCVILLPFSLVVFFMYSAQLPKTHCGRCLLPFICTFDMYQSIWPLWQKLQLISLTFPAPIPDKEKKLTEIFIFKLLCGASKGFMKALKVFMHGAGRIKFILFHPSRRMNYSDAIEWLKADGYKKEDGTSYEFGEV